jgi:hypothetical protein
MLCIYLYMEISISQTKNKAVLVSFSTWLRLRNAAFERNTSIKNIFERIMSGKINPITMESLK